MFILTPVLSCSWSSTSSFSPESKWSRVMFGKMFPNLGLVSGSTFQIDYGVILESELGSEFTTESKRCWSKMFNLTPKSKVGVGVIFLGDSWSLLTSILVVNCNVWRHLIMRDKCMVGNGVIVGVGSFLLVFIMESRNTLN